MVTLTFLFPTLVLPENELPSLPVGSRASVL